MYENWLLPTHPGTDMKVIPEMDAPIIPKATRYHGDLRRPMKKVALSAFLPVMWATMYKRARYKNMMTSMLDGDMIFDCFLCKNKKLKTISKIY